MENQHEAFEACLLHVSEDIQQVARQTRALIYKVLPEVVELVWVHQKISGYGTGVKKKTEHFCWIMPAKKHVTLGFNYGAELPDPKALLEGTGKLYRHIKIRSSDQLSNKDLIKLLTYASTYRVPKPKAKKTSDQ